MPLLSYDFKVKLKRIEPGTSCAEYGGKMG